MRPIRSDGRAWLRTVVITAASAILVASVSAVLASRYRTRPVVLVGAVVQQNEDARKQTPVTDVQVAVGDGQDSASAKTDISGYFKLKMKPGWRRGQIVTLEFRNPKYKPLNIQTVVGDEPYVVHMVPLRRDEQPALERPAIKVTNVLVRYSTEATAELNVGSEVKTFQVPNKGDIPCDKHPPCSPDDKWKAAIGSESLDAGQGNVFENARVFCIAGPCPFTKIEADNFSGGGRRISVSVRNWSDTTTFMFQAEVFREQVSDIIRETYPVIFGQTFNFSLPAAAEGPSLEAELDGAAIIFPLGPTGAVSWAACDIMLGKNRSKSYRCELKPGYAFP
jgi:hypothetical protein